MYKSTHSLTHARKRRRVYIARPPARPLTHTHPHASALGPILRVHFHRPHLALLEVVVVSVLLGAYVRNPRGRAPPPHLAGEHDAPPLVLGPRCARRAVIRDLEACQAWFLLRGCGSGSGTSSSGRSGSGTRGWGRGRSGSGTRTRGRFRCRRGNPDPQTNAVPAKVDVGFRDVAHDERAPPYDLAVAPTSTRAPCPCPRLQTAAPLGPAPSVGDLGALGEAHALGGGAFRDSRGSTRSSGRNTGSRRGRTGCLASPRADSPLAEDVVHRSILVVLLLFPGTLGPNPRSRVRRRPLVFVLVLIHSGHPAINKHDAFTRAILSKQDDILPPLLSRVFFPVHRTAPAFLRTFNLAPLHPPAHRTTKYGLVQRAGVILEPHPPPSGPSQPSQCAAVATAPPAYEPDTRKPLLPHAPLERDLDLARLEREVKLGADLRRGRLEQIR